jgi:outer membrane protein TolC
LNQYTLQATLNVPLSDYLLRIPQNYAAATKNAKAAALTEKATRYKVATDARAMYYTWVRAKLQRVVAEQALAQAKAHVVDVRNAFEAGSVSRADVLRFESQLASSRLFLERAESFANLTETQIRIAMHDPEGAPYQVGESVDSDDARESAAMPGENLSALWTEASTNRLEVRALDESAGSLRDQAKVARAGYYPRLDGAANLIHANPNQRVFPSQEAFKTTWDAGLSLTWSPNDVGNAAAQSDGIRLEVTQSRNALREAKQAIESSAQGLVAAEESYRVRRSLFQNGRATSVELTDAETDLTRARLESINSRVDLQVAKVRLEHALGRDVAGR